jgi:hypothetical protein
VILTPGSWDSTGKLADADEDGKVAEPDENEAVDKTSGPTTVVVRSMFVLRRVDRTYFVKPIEKILS